MRRAAALAIAIVLAAVGGWSCGGGDSEPLVDLPVPARPDSLYGTWTANPPGGYRLTYVFRSDGTYEHHSIVRQREEGGRSSFEITARGTMRVQGRTLVLRPRRGTKKRRDTTDPGGDYTRPLERHPQRYEWSMRGTGAAALLTLTIGGGLAVTYRRG